MTEKEKKIFEMQAPSTRRAMARPESEDITWFNRPTPKEAIAVPDAKSDEERVGARGLSFKEVLVEDNLRYNRGSYLAQMRNEPDASSVDEPKRSRAINAFMFIKLKFKDLMCLSGLAPKEEWEKSKLEK